MATVPSTSPCASGTNHIKQADYLEVGSQAIIALKKAYDKAGISLPFPIRTLYFGIKGGVSLEEMLGEKKG